MHPKIRALSLIWYFIYLGFGIYGCMQIREGLEPVNILVEDSYAIPHYKVLEKYFWHYGAQVQVCALFYIIIYYYFNILDSYK